MNCLLWNESQGNHPGVITPWHWDTTHISVHQFRDQLIHGSVLPHGLFIHSCLPGAALWWEPLTPYEKPVSFNRGQELWQWVSKECCAVKPQTQRSTYILALVYSLKGPGEREGSIFGDDVSVGLFFFTSFPWFHHIGIFSINILQNGHNLKKKKERQKAWSYYTKHQCFMI